MNGIRVCSPALCLFALFLSACYAEKLPIVRGHVEGEGSFFGNEYVIEMQNQSRSSLPFQASVANDGSFEFRDVAAGMYQMRLTSNRGVVVAEQLVDLGSYIAAPLTIKIPSISRERPVSGTVSVADLQRKIPSKAFRAFEEAGREAHAGHELEAVRKLQRALEVAPNYSDARSNLGVQFVHLRRYPEALEQFERAIAIGPPSAMLYGNLAYSLIAVGRLQDAEAAARHAISLDDSYARGHYLLGNILAKRVTPKSLEMAPEAALHLRRGAAEMPHAYIMIAQIYLVEGDNQSAAEELRLYLKSGNQQYRAQAEQWVAALINTKPSSR